MSRMEQFDKLKAELMQDEDWDIKLWNKAGYFAMIFCIWCAFVIPVLLVLDLRG